MCTAPFLNCFFVLSAPYQIWMSYAHFGQQAVSPLASITKLRLHLHLGQYLLMVLGLEEPPATLESSSSFKIAFFSSNMAATPFGDLLYYNLIYECT